MCAINRRSTELTRARLLDTIQRSINENPDLSTRPADADSESAQLITSLRTRVKAQSDELEDLQEKLAKLTKESEAKLEEARKEWEAKIEVLEKEREEEVSPTSHGRPSPYGFTDTFHPLVVMQTSHSASEISSLTLAVSTLTASLTTAQTKHGEDEKEQEDLLVLLEELSSKRRKDKVRLKEAGLEVSDEEEGDEEDDEDADEDE